MNLFWRQTKFAWMASKKPFTDKNRFVIDDGGTPDKNIYLLCARLLEIGGQSVVIRLPEPEMNLILRKGRLFSAFEIDLDPGDEGQCHSNCSKSWMENKRRFHICTGYGLTNEDQLWRQHTWLLDKQKHALLETTVIREKYYGVELRGLRAYMFADINA